MSWAWQAYREGRLIEKAEADALRALLSEIEYQFTGETDPVKRRFADLRARIRATLETPK